MCHCPVYQIYKCCLECPEKFICKHGCKVPCKDKEVIVNEAR